MSLMIPKPPPAKNAVYPPPSVVIAQGAIPAAWNNFNFGIHAFYVTEQEFNSYDEEARKYYWQYYTLTATSIKGVPHLHIVSDQPIWYLKRKYESPSS